MAEALNLERFADRADASVHHVAGRDDVRARARLIERLADQHLDRFVVEDIACRVDQPVLPVAGVGIERDVGQHADRIAERVLDRRGRAAHQIVGIERFGAVLAAPVGLRIGKEGETGDARVDRIARARNEQVDRPSRHAGQAGDRFFDTVARTDEQRPDQIGGGQLRLAHHRAAPRGSAGAAQAQVGESGMSHARVHSGAWSPGKWILDIGAPRARTGKPAVRSLRRPASTRCRRANRAWALRRAGRRPASAQRRPRPR